MLISILNGKKGGGNRKTFVCAVCVCAMMNCVTSWREDCEVKSPGRRDCTVVKMKKTSEAENMKEESKKNKKEKEIPVFLFLGMPPVTQKRIGKRVSAVISNVKKELLLFSYIVPLVLSVPAAPARAFPFVQTKQPNDPLLFFLRNIFIRSSPSILLFSFLLLFICYTFTKRDAAASFLYYMYIQ